MTAHNPGDFRLLKIKGAAGEGIRFGQWLNGDGYGDYEHAQVYMGGHRFLDAEPGGANIATYGDLDEGMWSTGVITTTYDQRVRILQAAYSYVGVPYSFADYGALALHRLHIPAPHLNRYVKSSKHMICSQLTDQCYVDAEVHLFTDGRWPGDVTPGDLYKLLQGRQ